VEKGQQKQGQQNMKAIYKNNKLCVDLSNEVSLVNRLRNKFRSNHIEASIVVRESSIVDCSAKRNMVRANISEGKIRVDEYAFDDAEDAADYIFGLYEEK